MDAFREGMNLIVKAIEREHKKTEERIRAHQTETESKCNMPQGALNDTREEDQIL